MERRIFGLGTEYGVTCTYRGQRRLSPDEVARYLFRRVVSWGRSSNVFLRNGARPYPRVGSHPQHPPPQCDSLVDLVTPDSAGNSYGCHENYCVGRQGEFGRLADVLIPYLVTRQIICGAGKVLQTPRGAVYCVSQRAEHIWEGVSSATTRSRPIINTRDEPHADAERYRRLHVIVGDSNMNETTTLLKVTMTDLVLRMIEPGVPVKDMTLENPIRAIREISHDMTGRRKVRLANGREMSALEIQTEYHNRAVEYADREGFGPVHRQMLELWGRVLKAVDTEDLSLIDRVAHEPRIFEAKNVPPQTTRARLRGEFIRRAQEKRRDFTVDWVHLKLNDQAQRTVLCKDPFKAVDDRVEKLIASM